MTSQTFIFGKKFLLLQLQLRYVYISCSMYIGTVLYSTPVQASLDTLLSTRVISVYTATVTEHSHPASHWSSGPIKPSDWLTPQTDTRARVGPNNCSLHNTVQSTQHLPCTHLNSSSRENYQDISENIVTSDMGMWHYMWWGRGRRKKFPQTFSENFLDVRPSVTLCDDNVRSHYTRCYGYFSPRYRSLSPNIRHPSLHLPFTPDK